MSLKVFNGVEWVSTGIPGPKGDQGATGLYGVGETGLQGVTGLVYDDINPSFYSVEITGDRVTGLSLLISPIMYGTGYTGPEGSFPEGTLYFQFI